MAASSGEEGSNCAEARVESATSGQWQLRGGATGTHALLAARLGNRRISSKEDTGTNPSIILHMTAPRVWVGNWVIPVRALYKWSNSQSPEKQNRYSNFDDLCQYFSNTAVF